jgi:hypothetical protein
MGRLYFLPSKMLGRNEIEPSDLAHCSEKYLLGCQDEIEDIAQSLYPSHYDIPSCYRKFLSAVAFFLTEKASSLIVKLSE